GFVVGAWLRTKRPIGERCAGLLAAGLLVTMLGLLMHRWFMPINKQIWTPSFVVFCAGMGMVCLGVVFWIVDVVGYRRWALPFVIFGMNAIAAFVAAGIVTRLGLVIRFTPPKADKSVSLIGFCQEPVKNLWFWIHNHDLSDWMQSAIS